MTDNFLPQSAQGAQRMMKFIKNFSLPPVGSAVLLLMVLFTAVSCRNALPPCEDPLGCVTVRPNESIQIAYLLSMSGNTAVIGEDALRGLEMAVADRDGELLNHPIELLGFDSGCNQRMGGRAADSIADNETVLGIIGPTCSDVARTVIPTVGEAGQLIISPSANASSLTGGVSGAANEYQGSFFRTVPNNLAQAEIAATYAFQILGKETAVTIHDGTAYSRELQQAFSQAFQRLGGSVLFQGSVVIGETAIQDILTELVGVQPDVIYLPLFAPEANLVALRLLEMNDTDEITLIGADSLFNPEFAISAETAAENMLISGTAVTTPAYNAFLEAWANRYETAPKSNYHAHAYDATNMLLDAINEVAIRSGDSLLIGRQALRNTVQSMSNYRGLTGTIICQSTGDCAAIDSIGIYQFTNDETSGKNWPPEVVWKQQN